MHGKAYLLYDNKIVIFKHGHYLMQNVRVKLGANRHLYYGHQEENNWNHNRIGNLFTFSSFVSKTRTTFTLEAYNFGKKKRSKLPVAIILRFLSQHDHTYLQASFCLW